MTPMPRRARPGRAARVLALTVSAGVVASTLVAVTPAAPAVAASTLAAAASKSVALPYTARVVAGVKGWKLAGPEALGEVAAEVGSARTGSVALSVDAPKVAKTTVAASVTATVRPSTTYRFTGWVRLLSKTTRSVPARFTVGAANVSIPSLNATWAKVTRTVKTGPAQTTLATSLVVTKALRGLSVDGLSLAATSGPTKGRNVLPNASFEDLTVGRGIVNSSLVVTRPTATVAAALPRGGKVTWSLSSGSKTVKTGSVAKATLVTAIPVKGVRQGLYTLRVRGGDKKLYTTTLAILDSPTPWITQDPRFGIGVHVEGELYADAARYTRALGISHVRSDVRWSRVERQKGRYDWSVYDAPFARMNAQGLGVLGIAGYGNDLYGTANAAAPRTSTGSAAYGRYAAAMAGRYPLSGIEVYNEFNFSHNESNCRSAACYLPLAKQVDRSVGAVKKTLPIVVGGTAKYPDPWFRDLWKRGGLRHADVVSFHPYEKTSAPEGIAALVAQSRATMKKYGKATRPVWITELGTSAAKGNRTPTEQASVLTRSSVSALAGGASRFYWYNLINDGSDPKAHFDNFGLYSHPVRGVAAVAPKPAAFAQALLVTQLGSRKYWTSDKAGSGVISRAFGSKSDTVRVVWAPKGKKTASIRSSKPVVVVAADGSSRTVKPTKGVVKISVTTNPVFVRSGAATKGVTR